MKAYTNEQNEIKAVRKRPSWDSEQTLKEVDIPAEKEGDFFYGKCAGFICGYKYGEEVCGYTGDDPETGDPIMGLVIAPYKSLEMLEALQDEYESTKDKNDAMAAVAQITAMSFTDEQALMVKTLYPVWSELPDGTQLTKQEEATEPGAITKVIGDDGKLCKVIQSHKKQSDWAPGQATASLFTVIDEQHAGTKEDPIPYSVNMIVYQGKIYSYNGVLYECTRDSEIALQYTPDQLIGHYFKVAE